MDDTTHLDDQIWNAERDDADEQEQEPFHLHTIQPRHRGAQVWSALALLSPVSIPATQPKSQHMPSNHNPAPFLARHHSHVQETLPNPCQGAFDMGFGWTTTPGQRQRMHAGGAAGRLLVWAYQVRVVLSREFATLVDFVGARRAGRASLLRKIVRRSFVRYLGAGEVVDLPNSHARRCDQHVGGLGTSRNGRVEGRLQATAHVKRALCDFCVREDDIGCRPAANIYSPSRHAHSSTAKTCNTAQRQARQCVHDSTGQHIQPEASRGVASLAPRVR